MARPARRRQKKSDRVDAQLLDVLFHAASDPDCKLTIELAYILRSRGWLSLDRGLKIDGTRRYMQEPGFVSYIPLTLQGERELIAYVNHGRTFIARTAPEVVPDFAPVLRVAGDDQPPPPQHHNCRCAP